MTDIDAAHAAALAAFEGALDDYNNAPWTPAVRATYVAACATYSTARALRRTP